jgi:signal transduction protein with GAF and PtsI domain
MNGSLRTEPGRRALLQSIVDLTRTLFAARACSIMSHDEAKRELVFEVVAGEGAGTLEGRRLADNTGIAGWSLASEEPISIADVVQDPRFARDVAESTGYVPTSLIVYPLLSDERSLGVLNVLDQRTGGRVGLADMNALALIATHAAAVLSVVQAARAAEAGGSDGDAVERLRRAVDGMRGARREAVVEVVEALERLIGS